MVRLTVICMFVIFLMALQHSLVESKSSKSSSVSSEKSSKKSSHKKSKKSSGSSTDVTDGTAAEILDQNVEVGCPSCEAYEVCNNVTNQCSLKECDFSQMVDGLPCTNITASSHLDDDHIPSFGMFANFNNSWIPANQSTEEYIQYDFGTVVVVSGFIQHPPTRGDGMTLEYKFTTSLDCLAFTPMSQALSDS